MHASIDRRVSAWVLLAIYPIAFPCSRANCLLCMEITGYDMDANHGAGFGYTLCTASIFSSTSADNTTSALSRFSFS